MVYRWTFYVDIALAHLSILSALFPVCRGRIHRSQVRSAEYSVLRSTSCLTPSHHLEVVDQDRGPVGGAVVLGTVVARGHGDVGVREHDRP
ncbi:hypothetical protein GCM10027072_09850 [Streptomyces bullii]